MEVKLAPLQFVLLVASFALPLVASDTVRLYNLTLQNKMSKAKYMQAVEFVTCILKVFFWCFRSLMDRLPILPRMKVIKV